MHIKRNKGFTLIELLVVIAIIGILSSVVLASLNTARDRGRDAAVKSSMQTIRVQSELYYDSNGSSYGTNAACDGTGGDGMFDTAANNGDDTIAAAITEITAQADTGGVACDATGQTWAMTADLHEGDFWCTDYTGVAREVSAALGTDTECPAS